MVSKLFALLNKEVKTMNQGALLLALFSVASQLMGLLRDRLLAHYFGPSATLDVYYAAFRIPDFLYNSFASLVSVTALLPFLSEYLHSHETGGKHNLHDFSRSLFTVFTATMSVLCLIVFVCMRPLSFMIAPGFAPLQRTLFVTLSRILLLSPLFLGLSNLFGAFSQVQKKFYVFAVAPLFYNFCILLGILFFRPTLGIAGVVLGVVLGAFLHMGIQLPSLWALKSLPRFTLKPNLTFIRTVVSTSLSRTISFSLSSITIVVMGAIASLLATGSISIFNFAYNIQTTPFYIIGISYAVAAFPLLARFHTEKQHAEFVSVIYNAMKNIFFFAIPISLLFVVLRAQIVRVLLGSGLFSWNDTRLVAASLALFSLSITAQSLVYLLSRTFYASGDSRTPLRVNAATVVITSAFAVILLFLYKKVPSFAYFMQALLRLDGITGTNVILLPLAFALGQITNAYLLWRNFARKWRSVREGKEALGNILFHISGASIVAAGASYLMLNILADAIRNDHFLGVLLQGTLAGLFGTIVYLVLIWILDNNELKTMVTVVTSRFWKHKPIAPEQPEL